MARHFNGSYSVRAGWHGARKSTITNSSSVGENFVFCVECNRYYPKSANHMHDDMQYKSESDSDIETAHANAIYYKRQAESQSARIAELEAALREIATLAHEVPANIYTFRCQEIESKAKAALK